MKDRLKETPSIEEWLNQTLTSGQSIACDPYLFTISNIKRMQNTLQRNNILVNTNIHTNLVDQVWGKDQPLIPQEPVIPHAVSYAGKSHLEKIQQVQDIMKNEKGIHTLVITALDEIAWLFNIRGSDVACNPVTIAYAVITLDTITLCINYSKLNSKVFEHLGKTINIVPYEDILDIVRNAPGKIWLDPASCNYAIYNAAVEGGKPIVTPSTSLSSTSKSVNSTSTSTSSVSSKSVATPYGTGPMLTKRNDGFVQVQLPYGTGYIHETSVINPHNLGELTTPYGKGPVLSLRNDGFNQVQLPYGVAYIHNTTASSKTNSLPSEFTTPYGKGPVLSKRNDGFNQIQLPYGVAYIHSSTSTNTGNANASVSPSSTTPSSSARTNTTVSTTPSFASRASDRILEKSSPIQLLKAIKNEAEINGMKNAHIRDAVALVSFLSWLDYAVTKGIDTRTGKALTIPLTEYTVGEVLDTMRSQLPDYVSLSFETIAGFGPNGAIIHYRAEKDTAATITNQGVFLLDSGGQYRDGTTDVTRTVHFGTPTPREKMAYTAVLQGHIALSSARFPTGTSGIALDAYARAPLWQLGLDYRHGTGHGVGAFLNVHEGPQFIANAARSAYEGGLIEGMTITDEPGYYEDGNFGIRIENVLITKIANTINQFGGKPYLEFEPLTCVPITTKLIDLTMLTPKERTWINNYNGMVRTKLAPLLRGHALEYLLRETYPV